MERSTIRAIFISVFFVVIILSGCESKEERKAREEAERVEIERIKKQKEEYERKTKIINSLGDYRDTEISPDSITPNTVRYKKGFAKYVEKAKTYINGRVETDEWSTEMSFSFRDKEGEPVILEIKHPNGLSYFHEEKQLKCTIGSANISVNSVTGELSNESSKIFRK